MRVRFDGWIAGLGTTSGTRLVFGHWPRSPLGPCSDVMLEHPDGHRVLLAGTADLAVLLSATYSFDEIVLAPFQVRHDGRSWTAAAGPLTLSFTTGPRRALGRLLRAVPAPLARSPAWIRLLNHPARLLLPGVRTYGTTARGRREFYGAQDLHPITTATATLAGTDLGGLTDVRPPVRFGFASTPPAPSLVRVTTTIDLPASRSPG